jgi:hypothetical protein
MRWLIWSLLLFNPQCMSVNNEAAAACILHQIQQFESQGTDFAALRAAKGAETEPESNQFTFTDLGACKGAAIVTRDDESGLVSGVHYTFEEPTTLPALTVVFGEFKHYPPSPSKKWSAIARMDIEGSAKSYAIIAESNAAITDESQILKVAIRIDYED